MVNSLKEGKTIKKSPNVSSPTLEAVLMVDHFIEETRRVYNITELWKYDLPKGWRLLYTVTES